MVTPIDEMPAAKAGIMTKSSTTSGWLPSYVELLSCLELMKVRHGKNSMGTLGNLSLGRKLRFT